MEQDSSLDLPPLLLRIWFVCCEGLRAYLSYRDMHFLLMLAPLSLVCAVAPMDPSSLSFKSISTAGWCVLCNSSEFVVFGPGVGSLVFDFGLLYLDGLPPPVQMKYVISQLLHPG